MTERIVSTATNAGEHPETSATLPPQPIRIAFCITDLDVGGAERMFVELVTRLDREHWEPRVFCLSKAGPLVQFLEAANVPVTCFGATKRSFLRVLWQLKTELKRFSPSLIQSFLFHANIAARLAGWWAGVPRVVCGIRVAERRSRIPLWLDRLTRSLVDHHVCVSQAVAEFSIRNSNLDPRRVSVIPNGVDAARFATATPADRQSLDLMDGIPLILFVGRLDPQKAPLDLLEAFVRLWERHPSWQLLFIGDGPLRGQLQSEILHRRCSANVRVAGWRPDVDRWLKAADVLVLPSRWEGMPNIVLEAMAAGLPVVVSQVEGVAELIHPNETGWLATPGNIAEFEQTIEVVLTNRDAATKAATAAQDTICEGFTLQNMVASYDQLYFKLLTR